MRHVTDKDNVHCLKNSLELSQNIIKNGVNFYDGNANSEFTQLIGQNNQNIQVKLKAENRLMKESLIDLQKSLTEIMKIRKEMLLIRFGKKDNSSMNEEQDSLQNDELIDLRKDLMNLSIDETKMETLNVVKENVARFKLFMDKVNPLIITQYRLIRRTSKYL